MSKKIGRHSGITYTILFWLTLFLVLCLGIYLNARSQPLPMFQGTISYKEPGWMFGEKGRGLNPVRLSDRVVFEPGKVYVLTTDLTYTGEGDPYPSAFITTGNLEVEVYLHGESVFVNSTAQKVFPKVQSIGGSSFSVSLGRDCAGKNFRIELRTPMNHPVERMLPGVTFGDHEAQVRYVLVRCLPSIAIGCAILVAALILVLLGNTVDGTQWTYVYFSVFAILIVLYRAMQDLFLLYLWGNPFMAVLCEYFSLAACPIPLLMSYRYRLKPYGTVKFNILIGLSLFNLVMQSILHFTGIRDMMDMVLLTHLWLLVAFVGMIAIGVSVKKKTGQQYILRKIIPIILGALLDMVNYYYHKYMGLGEFYSMGDFVGLGLLVSLFMLIWEARKARIDAALAEERNNILQKVAYTDSLTGIKNRAAFTKALTKIATGKTYGRIILVVSADLNGLKQTNDRLGHSAGDRLIRRAAEALSECFQPWGDVYRTGGDEFFALLQNVDEEHWIHLKEQLDKTIEKTNEGESIFLSMAVGVAVLENGNINKAIQLSDQRMYEEKERQHRAMGDI